MDFAKNLKRRMRRKVKPKGMASAGLKPKRMKLKGFGTFGKTKGY
jgi:hypothetical protein